MVLTSQGCIYCGAYHNYCLTIQIFHANCSAMVNTKEYSYDWEVEDGIQGQEVRSADPNSPFIVIPLRLSALKLNEDVAASNDPKNWCIASFSRPDYRRLAQFATDIQERFHYLALYKGTKNPRITPVVPNRTRAGVYLHWELPPVYRSTAETDSQTALTQDEAKVMGFKDIGSRLGKNLVDPSKLDTRQQRLYRVAPDTWLVIRTVRKYSVFKSPTVPDTQAGMSLGQRHQVFIIESNRYRKPEPRDDIDIDMAPFPDVNKSLAEQKEYVNCSVTLPWSGLTHSRAKVVHRPQRPSQK